MTDTSLCCAPMVNLWGAYWPAWVACLVCGIAPHGCFPLIVLVDSPGAEFGSAPVVYPMLIVAYACGLWLLLYRA